MKTFRAFIALDLPDELRNVCTEIQAKIRQSGQIRASYIRPENMHLTLKFLGDIDADRMRMTCENISGIGEGTVFPFPVRLSALGVFTPDKIRVVWAALSSMTIHSLHSRIDRALRPLFAPEHNFVSHVTLLRPKTIDNSGAFLDLLDSIELPLTRTFPIASYSLYTSNLTPEGAIYTTVARYPLATPRQSNY